MAGIPLASAGKAPQEGLQEEEVEHSAFRATLPQATMEADARGGAVRCENAHCGATTEGMAELDELLQDPHVAQEEGESPMWGGVESLGNIKDQDAILLVTPLQSALCQEHRGCCR